MRNLVHSARRHSAVVVLLIQAFCSQALLAIPSVREVQPLPGFLNELTSVSVTFSEPVIGVRADDFLVNGVPADAMEGTGATYRFTFAQPAFGSVDISWGPLHSISTATPTPERFDAGAPGSTWAYQLVNPAGPLVARILPPSGTILRRLSAVEVSFDIAVTGVDASDLQLNGTAALEVSGVGAGPYLFSFAPAESGPARLEWSNHHGILTDSEMPFSFDGTGWSYAVALESPAPDVVINEILAENLSGLVDEDTDPEDWIELRNRGTQPVNLGGWSLSVDREDEGQWIFPAVTLPAGGYMVVWASGKDRRQPAAGGRFHTNFKLNANGDTLRLFGPDLPRVLIDEVQYPEQAPNFAYCRRGGPGQDAWTYLAEATPGEANSDLAVTGKVDEAHFSVERGFFNAPFNLTLACRTAGAEIRYTTNGSLPSLTNGLVYADPILISTTRVVRAAAFASDQLPSRVRTHTYLMNLANNRRLLPVLSLVTATNNLYGRAGIMEFNPRNTTKHGAAWERPVSVEWIRPEDNEGFQLEAGIRVAGGDYIRQRYNYRTTQPPEGKYSFRLYFRGDYGAGRLNYRVFPESTVESFNTLHLRAGMNDPTNPFIKDEFVRELSLDVGIPACHGTVVYLFLNGVYKGLYNPSERVDDDFLQAYHGGGDLWDVIGPNNVATRGDLTAWSQLRTAARKDLKIMTNYLDVARRMDLTNFVDYLLPLIWADNDDWPHNNTRAAREKKAGAPFRFYPWDAEFAFTSHSVSHDTIATTLSTLSPPWGSTDYQAMFNSLKKTTEFKLLFADRVHRAFFNDGPLTDARIQARYAKIKGLAAPSISGFSDVIGRWIAARRPYVLNSFQKAGFLASTNAPVPSQFGGRVPRGYLLTLANLSGAIFYTTNGVDPRAAFTGDQSPSAIEYRRPLVLDRPLHLMARSLDGTNWSALADVVYEISQVGSPLRISEIMFNPIGGDPYEYLELVNTGELSFELAGCDLDGIGFRFPTPFPELGAGERLVLASDARPDEFRRRYPGLVVSGWFSGALNNSGERIAVRDPSGRVIASATYSDLPPWPALADGAGSSLEIRDPLENPDDPSNWQASIPGGSPGALNSPRAQPVVRLSEISAGSDRDWLELHNAGNQAVALGGWSLTDNADPRQFVFPDGVVLSPGGFLRVECKKDASGNLTAPFQLNRQGETVALFDRQGERIDALQFGPVADGYSVGLVGNRIALCNPTPAGANTAAKLGALSSIRINEFLANSPGESDWIELYNPGSLPVALQGSFIATSNALARIASASFISPGGFAAFWADEEAGPDHLNLKLPASGGVIALLGPDGSELDRANYGPQAAEITMGRSPDGTGPFQALPSSTRAAGNSSAQLGTELRISEILAASEPGPDWVEIENASGLSMSLTGFTLRIRSGADSLTFSLPSSELSSGGRMLLYFEALPPGQSQEPASHRFSASLPDTGSRLDLLDPLGRLVDQVRYGPQVLNRSIGRSGGNWALLAKPTPGAPNAAAAAFDRGDDLRLNEWLAAGSGTNEFVEIYNPGLFPVNLGGWVLTDDPSIYGSTNRTLPPLAFVAAKGFVQFHADGSPEAGPDHLKFQLDRLGETIRLLNPSAEIIDTIEYGVQSDFVAEGRYPDGAERIVRFPGSASPAAANYIRLQDVDDDGMDDAWETRYGLDPNSAADAATDADGDGMTNREEFLSGTHPNNASSLLRLDLIGMDAGAPVMRFVAQPGLAYIVQYSDSLLAPDWRPLAEVAAGVTARELEIRDPSPSGSVPLSRFYRVTTRP